MVLVSARAGLSMWRGVGSQFGRLLAHSRSSWSPITANWCPKARAALSLILKDTPPVHLLRFSQCFLSHTSKSVWQKLNKCVIQFTELDLSFFPYQVNKNKKQKHQSTPQVILQTKAFFIYCLFLVQLIPRRHLPEVQSGWAACWCYYD